MRRIRPVVPFVVSGLIGCSSFAATVDDAGPASEIDASVPEAAAPDASAPDGETTATCPLTSFCDGFEREIVRGEWQYAPPSLPGKSSLEIEGATASSGTRSLVVVTGPGDETRVNFLTHTFAAAPTLPFEIHFALRVDELPTAKVRLISVGFDTGGSVWAGLEPNGIELGVDAVFDNGGSSSGSKAAELGALGSWATYTLTVRSTGVFLALDNGIHTASTVPYSVDVGAARSVELGIVRAAPSAASARFWIDDVVTPR